MSTLRRTAIAGIGLAASLVLAGCAGDSGGGDTGSGGSGGEKTSQSSKPQASGGPQIADPKDATAGDPCALLPPAAAAEVGVNSAGKQESSFVDDAAAGCVWEGQDGAKKVAFTPLQNRSIQVYYDNPDAYVDFKKLSVSGYPAVRANKDDPMRGGSCDIFVATNKNQVVQAYSRTPKVGQVDPCQISKNALKLSVSSWPAAK